MRVQLTSLGRLPGMGWGFPRPKSGPVRMVNPCAWWVSGGSLGFPRKWTLDVGRVLSPTLFQRAIVNEVAPWPTECRPRIEAEQIRAQTCF